MLVHSHAPDHTGQQAPADVPYEGAQHGMAADTLLVSPLTVQQELPNAGGAQTGTNHWVNPTHEQGEGRAPGWKWGWMRKVIPFSPRTAGSHKQRHFSDLRPQLRRAHPPGSGPGQAPGASFQGFRPNMTLAQPTTVYKTAAHPPLAPWSEPI